MRRRRWIWIAPLALSGMLLFIAIGGVLVLQLWNWLMPALFGWHEITLWQALGLLALCRIPFGRLGGPGFARSRFRRRMAERWQASLLRNGRDSGRAYEDAAGTVRPPARARHNEAAQQCTNQPGVVTCDSRSRASSK